MDVATIIDAAAPRCVLVVGSPPPVGRDYDLLAREADRSVIAAALQADGFEPRGQSWLRFEQGEPQVVDLITPAYWGLPDHETDALFAQAQRLDGCRRLGVPAPAHQLLILARKLPRTPGLLEPKHRQRVHEALARAPDAWERASSRAGDWGAQRGLRRLRSRYQRPRRAGWPPRWLRRPRRGAVIALSGLDGAGKSTQARALRAALTQLGYDAVVVWAPIGQSPSLDRFAGIAKRWMARLPFGPLAHADRESVDRPLLSQTEDANPVGGHGRRLAALSWSTLIALANAVSYLPSASSARASGRIVIYDRYVLDGIVDLRFYYAPEGRLRAQEALIRYLTPKPRCAFLLDVGPEAAHARKPDWSLAQTRRRAQLYRRTYEQLGVRRLDAERPADEIATQIVLEVLKTISF